MPKVPAKRPDPDARESISSSLARRLANLGSILGRIVPIPEEWRLEPALGGAGESPGMAPVECRAYKSLVAAWRKALRWTEGLDYALSIMLSSVISTRAVGDQLWVKVIGPASCGKSTLCEAVSVSKYILAKSTIRGFHSGWKDKDSGKDSSLVAMLNGLTLVTKDGDTLLQSPNLGQILSEARDIYDSVSRTHYRNATSNDYAGIRMTWILAGTSSLRTIDQSELGERFLDCVIMEGIDDDLEDEILLRVASRAARNVAIEVDGAPETQYDPDMATAMAMTGGYVNHLRESANQLLAAVDFPEPSLRRCIRLGKLVAYMRARPSTTQDENTEREFAARLVSQHVRLAACLAAVMNRPSVDKTVMSRVRRVALDTARGQTLDIADQLYHHADGLESRTLAIYTGTTPEKASKMLVFLKRIGVVEPNRNRAKSGARINQLKWVLTPTVRALYTDIQGD